MPDHKCSESAVADGDPAAGNAKRPSGRDGNAGGANEWPFAGNGAPRTDRVHWMPDAYKTLQGDGKHKTERVDKWE